MIPLDALLQTDTLFSDVLFREGLEQRAWGRGKESSRWLSGSARVIRGREHTCHCYHHHRKLGAGALCPAGGWGLPSSSDAPVSTSLGTESHGSPFGIRVGCHCHNNYCRRSSICPSRRGLRPLLLPTSRAALCRRTTGNSAAPPQSDWGAPQPAGRGGTGCSFPESLPPRPSLVSWSCPNKPRRQVA